jgi:hypothetical protein
VPGSGPRPRRIDATGLNLHEWRNGETAERVDAGYALNERVPTGRLRWVKPLANRMLSLTGLGESLKLYAEKGV